MIDSHSHLYCDAFDDDRDDVMRRAIEAGVSLVVLPGESAASVERQAAMHERWPYNTRLALGLHPEEVKGDWVAQLDLLEPMLDEHKPVAIGEVGLDLYWDRTYRREQQEALYVQLRWALRRDLPFILHCREALDDCLAVLQRFAPSDRPTGVWHCFAGNGDDAERVLSRGDFYLGVGGTVTFKRNDETRGMVARVGLDRLLLETDSPYLAPVPHRGKRNESAYVPLVAATVATVLGVDVDTVDTITTRNATQVFNL